jgi:hypothetical protein
MYRVLILGLIGAFLGGGVGVLIAVSDDENGVYIASDRPVTEDQVRAKLQSEGWAPIEVKRDDRYIVATVSKNGRVGRLTVDSLTGQLIADDRDDD